MSTTDKLTFGADEGQRIALIDCVDGTGHHARYGAEVAIAVREAGHVPIAMGPAGWCEAMAAYATGLSLDWRFPSGENYLVRNRSFRRFCQMVIDTCRRENIQQAHFLYIDGFLSALLNAWDGSAPRVTATLHWYPFLSHDVRGRAGIKQWIKGRMTLHWLQQLTRRGAKLGVHAREASTAMERQGITPVQFLPYPNLDTTIVRTEEARTQVRMALGLGERDTLFLCFGGTRLDKGCDLAVTALAGTASTCHLLIAGSSNHFSRTTLEQMAAELGVASRVHLDIRHIPDNELGQIFSGCDAVVLPYRTTFAGQSGPLITAIALELPVIASQLKVFEETLKGYPRAILAPPESISMLAAAFTATAGHPSPRPAPMSLNPSNDGLARFRAGIKMCYDWSN